MRTPFCSRPAFGVPSARLSRHWIRGRSGGSGFFAGRLGGGGAGAGAGARAVAARATPASEGPPSRAASGTSAPTRASSATQAHGPRRRRRGPRDAAQAGQQWRAWWRGERGRLTGSDANKSRGISVQRALWTAPVDAARARREATTVTGRARLVVAVGALVVLAAGSPAAAAPGLLLGPPAVGGVTVQAP